MLPVPSDAPEGQRSVAVVHPQFAYHHQFVCCWMRVCRRENCLEIRNPAGFSDRLSDEVSPPLLLNIDTVVCCENDVKLVIAR